jgi:hypothetical protein
LYNAIKKKLSEVVKTQNTQLEPRIYGVKISQDGDLCYCISVKHTGHFNLRDYEELDFEVKSVRLVKKNGRF